MKGSDFLKFRNAYERGIKKGVTFKEPSMTQQHFEPECNVNNIITRYTATGMIPEDVINSAAGVYGDFSNVEDFQQMQNRIISAKQKFDELPSAIRRRFDDDPAKLIAFIRDESNYDEAVKLGIVSPKSATLERENVVVDKDVNNV